LGIEIKVKVRVRFLKPEHKVPGITQISGELPNTGMNPIIFVTSFPTYPWGYQPYFLLNRLPM
jgi:hypothetical protein